MSNKASSFEDLDIGHELIEEINQIDDFVAMLYSEAFLEDMSIDKFRALLMGYVVKIQTRALDNYKYQEILFRSITSEEAKAVGFYHGLINPCVSTKLFYEAESAYDIGHMAGAECNWELRQIWNEGFDSDLDWWREKDYCVDPDELKCMLSL